MRKVAQECVFKLFVTLVIVILVCSVEFGLLLVVHHFEVRLGRSRNLLSSKRRGHRKSIPHEITQPYLTGYSKVCSSVCTGRTYPQLHIVSSTRASRLYVCFCTSAPSLVF